MKVAIITDGNNGLGMGHVYQSISLAGLLKQNNQYPCDIFFLTKSSENVIKLITESGFSICHYPDDSAIFNALKDDRPDRIIFDKLDVSPILAKQIKQTLHIKLCIFTNLTEANAYADITVLADIGSNFKNIYKKNTESDQIQFFGPKYWILRPDFYNYRKRQKGKVESTEKIMLMFGGADKLNLTSAVLNTILQIRHSFNITVVLGSAFIHEKELHKVIADNSNTRSHIQVMKSINNVAEIMYLHDVVFASPGLSFFESLAVGTPVLGFHQDKLQQDIYRGFLTTYDKNELQELPQIIRDQKYIFPSDPFIQSMEIGSGKDDIIKEILK
jgi:spore coat polysaccharide biosynthesis predicted glycosyltransferase SpsG